MSLFRRILVPIDDTPLSAKALHYAFGIAERFGAKVTVLYVRTENRVANVADARRDEQEFEYELQTVRQTALQTLAAEKHTLPPDFVTADVRTGDPTACILEASVEHGADLLIMGTHGIDSLKDRLFGSTSERVLRDGTCPILVVREDPAPPPIA